MIKDRKTKYGSFIIFLKCSAHLFIRYLFYEYFFRKFFIIQMEQNIDKAFIITKKIKQDKNKKKNKIHNLYQEVIQKNFSTISDLLKKLTALTSKHQEIQQEFQTISKRMTKFQTDLQSIHNEHRRDNLHLFSNISEIRTQLAGIDAHIKLLFEDLKLKKSNNEREGAKKLFFVNKSKSLYTLNNQQSDSSINNLPLQEQIEVNKKSESILIKDSSRRDQLSIKEIKNIRNQQDYHLGQNPYSKINYSDQIRKTNKYLTCAYPKQNENMEENQPDQRESQNNLSEQDIVSSLPSKQREQMQFYFRQRKRQFRTILQKSEDQQYLNYQIKHQQRNVDQNITRNQANKLVSQSRKLVLSQQSGIISLEIYNQIKIEQKRMQDHLTKAIDKIQAKLQENQRNMIEGRIYYDQKFQKIQPQITFIQQKCQKFVTEDTLNNETFKLIEKHKQNWEDCYYFFAHKQETKNALQYLEQRLKYYIQNSNIKGINQQGKEKVSEVQETKCLCCTRSIPKNTYNKIDLSTMRKASNSLQATTKRLKPNQLKKKAVEILNRTRKQIPRLTS